MVYECTNAYYFRNLNKIGGIESHLYYIARTYGKYDIAVVYKNADGEQIRRLEKYVRCIKIEKNDRIICRKLFCCFNREILDQCDAEEKILVLHGDYKAMVDNHQMSMQHLPIDNRIDRYIGVSQTVCDSFEKLTGIKAENVYQPIVMESNEKPLLFISATRLTMEKGWNRMVSLAKALNENNVNYLWFIFTDSQKIPEKNMILLSPRLDISSKMGCFDAFIQLSDNEGYCLSVVEALLNDVPVICTDLPVFKELGLNEKNSIKLDFDMKNIPVEKIRNISDMKFSYRMKKDRWGEYLIKEKSLIGRRNIKVRALNGWTKRGIKDVQLNRVPQFGEEWEVDIVRYEKLMKYQEENRLSLIERV